MIDVDEADACTEDAILGQPEEIQRMLEAPPSLATYLLLLVARSMHQSASLVIE